MVPKIGLDCTLSKYTAHTFTRIIISTPEFIWEKTITVENIHVGHPWRTPFPVLTVGIT